MDNLSNTIEGENWLIIAYSNVFKTNLSAVGISHVNFFGHHSLEFVHYRQSHGFVMRHTTDTTNSRLVTPCPYALLPTLFPRKCYEKAADVQLIMNKLYYNVSQNGSLLRKSLVQVTKSDEFARNLMKIYDQAYDETGIRHDKQSVCTLVLMRSDYMLESKSQKLEDSTLQQIEVNLIAASAGGFATKCCAMHAHTMQQKPVNLPAETAEKSLFSGNNTACETMFSGLASAHDIYKCKDANRPKVVLFVVESENRNALDQRLLEYGLNSKGIRCIRKTLSQCDSDLHLDESGCLLVNAENVEISVVYFRYTIDAEWRAREKMELSCAIKVPTIPQQLANMKKLQQVLCETKVLQTMNETPHVYTPISQLDTDEIDQVMSTFVPQHGLDVGQNETQKYVDEAISSPGSYVLKPQLEGGGNNIYGEKMVVALKTMNEDERAAYILMRKIETSKGQNYLIRPENSTEDNCKLRNTNSELGIYGFLLADANGKIVRNQCGGHLLRTKAFGVDEGGIMAGASVIDCPFLV